MKKKLLKWIASLLGLSELVVDTPPVPYIIDRTNYNIKKVEVAHTIDTHGFGEFQYEITREQLVKELAMEARKSGLITFWEKENAFDPMQTVFHAWCYIATKPPKNKL